MFFIVVAFLSVAVVILFILGGGLAGAYLLRMICPEVDMGLLLVASTMASSVAVTLFLIVFYSTYQEEARHAFFCDEDENVHLKDILVTRVKPSSGRSKKTKKQGSDIL